MSEGSPLTAKQKLFAEAYVACLNATEAARRAGYKGSDNTLAVTGHDNLRKPKFQHYFSGNLVKTDDRF